MNYESFSQNVISTLRESLSIRDKGIVVDKAEVIKNNGVVLNGLVIGETKEAVSCSVYLEHYYKCFEKGILTIDKVAEDIIRTYEANTDKIKECANFLDDYSNIKEHVYCKLVNYNLNRQSLKSMVYRKYLDLAMVYYIRLPMDGEMYATVDVLLKYIHGWNVQKGVFHRQAIKNTLRDFPPVISPISDVIADIVIGSLCCDDEDNYGGNSDISYAADDSHDSNVSEPADDSRYKTEKRNREIEAMVREELCNYDDIDEDIYVLTNSSRVYGAVGMVLPGVLEDFANKHGKDFLIVPSSVHEVLLVTGDKWSRRWVNAMVEEVNNKGLNKEDILSDHIYRYDKERGMLK